MATGPAMMIASLLGINPDELKQNAETMFRQFHVFAASMQRMQEQQTQILHSLADAHRKIDSLLSELDIEVVKHDPEKVSQIAPLPLSNGVQKHG